MASAAACGVYTCNEKLYFVMATMPSFSILTVMPQITKYNDALQKNHG